MNLNVILSELLIIANKLHDKKLTDVAADLDAAIFILSSEDAIPTNKSFSSIARENYLALEEAADSEIENKAIVAASAIANLQEKVLELEPKIMTAILVSLAQSLKSVVNPSEVVTSNTLKASTELLADAEEKLLSDDSLRNIGYRVGVVRSKLEQDDG